jgi:hypothetical protein
MLESVLPALERCNARAARDPGFMQSSAQATARDLSLSPRRDVYQDLIDACSQGRIFTIAFGVFSSAAALPMRFLAQ